MTEWKMKGQYIKNCNCIATCPCDSVGIPYPHKGCEGMAGMNITEGHFGTITLKGLCWVVVVKWPGPLHEGNGIAQPFIDARATKEQRDALLQILGGQAGNPLFQALAATMKTVLEPQFLPITFEFNKEKRTAKVVVPGFLETVSTPIVLPYLDGQNRKVEQRMTVKLPTGMEYKEFEVAHTAVLKGTGEIKFDHKGTHSSLAEVEHTEKGIVA